MMLQRLGNYVENMVDFDLDAEPLNIQDFHRDRIFVRIILTTKYLYANIYEWFYFIIYSFYYAHFT